MLGSFKGRTWDNILDYITPQCVLTGKTLPALACTSPAFRLYLEKRPCGLTVGAHNIRLHFSRDDDDFLIDSENDSDDEYREGYGAAPLASRCDVSFGITDAVSTKAGANRVAPVAGPPSASATPRKVRFHSNSSYAVDHCRLPLLDNGTPSEIRLDDASQHSSPEKQFPSKQIAAAKVKVDFEVSLAFTVIDSTAGEHQNSLWWVKHIADDYGMFLRHLGFRGRGCHTSYVVEAIERISRGNGSLLSLEMSNMWFFTIFLETIATQSNCLVELERLSLQDCQVFPCMEESIGELVTKLPSLQSLDLHQFDFSLGRAKQVLEALAEHPCLRHINMNDNLFRMNAQTVVLSNLQSIRKLEAFHVNHLPTGFFNFPDLFAYKTNLRRLQLSFCVLGEMTIRDLGHCLNVACLLEELLLDHCGITEAHMELLFPVVRRSNYHGAQQRSNNTPTMMSPLHPELMHFHGASSREDSRTITPDPIHHHFQQGAAIHHAENHHAMLHSIDAQQHARQGSSYDLGGHPISIEIPAGGNSFGSSFPSASGLGVNPYFQPTHSPLLLQGAFMPPASPLMHHDASPVSSACSPPRCIAPDDVICASLPNLRVLNLCGNNFGLRGLALLAHPLKGMHALQQLYIAQCGITVTADGTGGAALCDALQSVIDGLYVLDVSRNQIGDVAMEEMCDTLLCRLAANVAECYVAEVGISRRGVQRLCETLADASYLELLDISGNNWNAGVSAARYQDPTAQVALRPTLRSAASDGEGVAARLTALKSMRKLLEGCSDGYLLDDGTTVAPCKLRQIDISGIGVNPAELCSLFATTGAASYPLVDSNRVTSLHLSSITGATSSNASSAVEDSLSYLCLVTNIASLVGKTLTTLDLSRNSLGNDVVTAILACKCVAGNPADRQQCVSCSFGRLTKLVLRKVEFSEVDVGDTHQKEAMVTTGLLRLCELNLSANFITGKTFALLSHYVLQHLAELQRLDISQNKIFFPSDEIIERYPLWVDPPSGATVATEGPIDVRASSLQLQREVTEVEEPSIIELQPVVEPQRELGKRSSAPREGSVDHSPTNADSAEMPAEQKFFLKGLRKRRFHILGDFFDALSVAVRRCRGSLRRLKLDANGLSQLAVVPQRSPEGTVVKLLQPHREHGWGASTAINLLVGPLQSEDWRRGNSSLAMHEANWDTYLLFSIVVTSS